METISEFAARTSGFSEVQVRIILALMCYSAAKQREARSRRWTGEEWIDLRELLRKEARRSEALAEVIRKIDPAEFDALMNQK